MVGERRLVVASFGSGRAEVQVQVGARSSAAHLRIRLVAAAHDGMVQRGVVVMVRVGEADRQKLQLVCFVASSSEALVEAFDSLERGHFLFP